MPSRRFSRHDREVSTLLKRLESKERYGIVETEVPVYWYPSRTRKAGQLDVMTIKHWDDKKDQFTYWEVKTGHEEDALRKAKKQFNQVYSALKKSPFPTENYIIRFVYYNPRTGTVRHFRPGNI